MINPLFLYGAGAAFLVGAFSGWSVRDWKADADTHAAFVRADQLREKMQAQIDASSSGYENWRVGARERSMHSRNALKELYRDVEVPIACDVPPDARRLLEERIAGVNADASGEPRANMSESAKPARAVDRPRAAAVGD
jgi:hypothetical protein